MMELELISDFMDCHVIDLFLLSFSSSHIPFSRNLPETMTLLDFTRLHDYMKGRYIALSVSTAI